MHQQLQRGGPPVEEAQQLDVAERRVTQQGPVVLPLRGPALHPHAIVGGVALHHRRPRLERRVLRQVGDLVVEEEESAVRLDHVVEAAQGLGAVHPVEGAAHRRRAETAPLRPERLRASRANLHRRAGSADRRGRPVEHLRLGVDREHRADVRAKASASSPGPVPRSSRRSARVSPQARATSAMQSGG